MPKERRAAGVPEAPLPEFEIPSATLWGGNLAVLTALVGTPDRKYLWLLSRTPDIDEAVYQRYLDTAREQGYDLDGLIRNPN